MATKSKPTDQQILESNPQLVRHLSALHLGSLKDYRDWCAANGFCRKLHKTAKLRQREVQYSRRKLAVEAMLAKRREARNADHLLLRICRDQVYRYDWQAPLEGFYRGAHLAKHDGSGANIKPQVLEKLVAHLLETKARFLDGTPYYPRFGQRAGNSALEALPLIAAHCRRWIRPIESWTPTSRSPRRQFQSLLQHLFVQYGELPAFLDQVWLAGFAERSAAWRRIYLHLAAGHNLANCNLMPLEYTKKMAHHFHQAPGNSTIEQAIRWGEVKGLGGDDALAYAVLRSRLSVDFANHKFWRVVLQWLIRYPEVDRSQVGSIIDYIQFQRFVPHYVLTGEGDPQATNAREPNFTMRGRTPQSLLRQVERWHGTVHDTFVFGMHDWPPCGIAGFDVVEEEADGQLAAWTIRELLSSKQIVQEGEVMSHCVATYIDLCEQGLSSIWSLERETPQGKSRALTIEVRPQDRQIAQYSGSHNRVPTEEECRIIRQWAQQARLRL
ncbi:PcfJ domain-containing protein [Blastopirellula retiformator]|uniref:PcfJ-like protein n=1 Tax=Blastopirellula retiformator TaxID=2527970 RepID=A0A5C5UZJ1_9BACT|nr:PcfJ domain-containing protein [Blastopirellula retiformator]TWT30915.1 hypothetical protein Enr8_44410 [Blastopirellula retiformator]